MKNKIKIEDVKENEVTEEILTRVDYGDFQALFTKFEIGSVFRAGKKKVDMIREAITALKVKKELEKNGSEEDIEDAIKQSEEKKKVKVVKKVEEQKSDLRKRIEGMKLSPEQIQRNIQNIKAMLKEPVVPSRNALLKKKEILESLK